MALPIFFVRHHDLDYHAPARLDDWLDIGVRCAKVGRSAITVNWAMWSAGRLLVTGNTVYVMTLLSDGRPTAVPDTVRAQLAAHEDGQSPYAWQLGGWSELGEGARAVRLPVFVDEQGVSADKELDDWDAVAVHGVLRNQAGLAVATGRLMLNVAEAHAAPHDAPALGHARLGRLAVLRSARGAGLGRRVLQSLLAHAWTQGVHTVHIHAQCTAQPLYAALGFQPVGPVFEEEGLAHQAMVLKRSA